VPLESNSQILSVSDLTRYVEQECAKDFCLFRGQRRDKALLPRIALAGDKSDILAIEQVLFNEFVRRSRPFLEIRPDDPWDWLALAQHFGLTTRLLDWTDNPLAGLWFAVNGRPQNLDPGVLWVFRVPPEDILPPDYSGSPFEEKRTKVFRPRHITKRIAAQGGWFTVHKFMEEEKKFVPLEKNKSYKARLEKLIIPAASFSELRKQLNRFAVNAAALFPDLVGLCQHLNWSEF